MFPSFNFLLALFAIATVAFAQWNPIGPGGFLEVIWKAVPNSNSTGESLYDYLENIYSDVTGVPDAESLFKL